MPNHKLQTEGYFVKNQKNDEPLETNETSKIIRRPHLEASIFSLSKRVVDFSITMKNVKKTKSVYYIDTDSLQTEKKQLHKLSEAGFVGKEFRK